jgi:uncharacterized protein (DUF2164 family)
LAIKLSKESRKKSIASIRRYVAENMEEEIGDLKASLLLDYFLEEVGPSVYNQAIADAQAYFQEKLADLEGVCSEVEFAYWR